MNRIKFVLLMAFSVIAAGLRAQTWTAQEIKAANTAASIQELTLEEKNVITYLNLARMYPKKFAQIELKEYSRNKVKNDSNVISLINTLMSMKPVAAVNFSRRMYQSARCFSEESASLGTVGHNRKKCLVEFGGECCSYGMETGLTIILQFLIDHGVPSLGHRKICLDPIYKFAGASMNSHPAYGSCCVLDFAWGNE